MRSFRRFIGQALLAALITTFVVPPQVMRAQGATETKRAVKTKVTPTYSELARRMNVHGKVRLEVTVAPDGTVKNVHAVGGHPLLVSASQDAVRNWKFEPAPKETIQIVEINFD
ncbi:MAG TPA: energy transducer TonB [Candidatus Acidoferrales bacterium]|nr:energy transducer TonB [Candidatus Acidoferrales bacterium]